MNALSQKLDLKNERKERGREEGCGERKEAEAQDWRGRKDVSARVLARNGDLARIRLHSELS